MTRADLSVLRDGQWIDLVIEGELTETYSHEPRVWDYWAFLDGQPWDGKLSAVENAQATYALCEAERQARDESIVERDGP